MTTTSPSWPGDSRSRVTSARVARFGTVRPDGRPHLVPVTFALADDTVVTAVDHKPKSTTALQRLANIAADPRVTLLVDHYDEDWQQLWWVRLDGTAHVVATDDDERAGCVELLAAKYADYRERPPAGPAVIIRVQTVVCWSAAD